MIQGRWKLKLPSFCASSIDQTVFFVDYRPPIVPLILSLQFFSMLESWNWLRLKWMMMMPFPFPF